MGKQFNTFDEVVSTLKVWYKDHTMLDKDTILLNGQYSLLTIVSNLGDSILIEDKRSVGDYVIGHHKMTYPIARFDLHTGITAAAANVSYRLNSQDAYDDHEKYYSLKFKSKYLPDSQKEVLTIRPQFVVDQHTITFLGEFDAVSVTKPGALSKFTSGYFGAEFVPEYSFDKLLDFAKEKLVSPHLPEGLKHPFDHVYLGLVTPKSTLVLYDA